MRFCVLNSERHGTSYHELYKGQWDPENPEFWRDDSLYIHDDFFNEIDEWAKPVLSTYGMFTILGI